MTVDKEIFSGHLYDVLESARFLLSDVRPSEWTEQNRVMNTDETSVPGPFSFKYTPYLKEVVDCLSHNHPARIIAVMKGAQIGFSTGVIESGIGWIISQNPGNILFLSGHQELSEEAMNGKIDKMIDSCGLRPQIKPNVIRKRNQRTGDTSKSKEFPGGSLVAGSASNHKLLRQRSIRYGFIDDFDSAKKSSKESGNTRTLIQQRFAAYYDKMKLFYISTPEVKQTSNIEPVYQLGDQRRYFIPCPCCGEEIPLYWECEREGSEGTEKAGITWQLDENNKLIPESVGYICQKCGEFFDDSLKAELLLAGVWKPTAEPSEVGYYSYHIACLYAPPGMYDWTYYVRQYLEACPPGEKVKDDLFKTFTNLCLGETYEQRGSSPEANAVQKNIRGYEIGIVPENVSVKDGNGKIIMLSCAADLNGTEQDARLDYEITGWAESGSSYSIRHGNIGTFVPRESQIPVEKRVDRERWTYEHNKPKSVWVEFEKVLQEVFNTDSGRRMKIVCAGVDCGHFTNHAYAFIDKTNSNVLGLRGDKENKYRAYGIDTAVFKHAKERAKLFMLDVNLIKDKLSDAIDLKWDHQSGEPQPPEFMNFPTPSGGMYLFNNYFSHYEAEHKVADIKDGETVGFRWVKKQSNSQNHLFDVKVYNYAMREIWAYLILKQLKKKGTWADFVQIIKGEVKKPE
jgi:phage terminase large subunit GpA-like protein